MSIAEAIEAADRRHALDHVRMGPTLHHGLVRRHHAWRFSAYMLAAIESRMRHDVGGERIERGSNHGLVGIEYRRRDHLPAHTRSRDIESTKEHCAHNVTSVFQSTGWMVRDKLGPRPAVPP